MAKVNLSQAAKLVGKNRTTIWRNVNSGKLSIERDVDGLPLVETSELIRVYGELKNNASPKVQHKATPKESDLIKVVESLREELAEMKEEIRKLNNRLTYKPEPEEEPKRLLPQNDPDWPTEVRTLRDISLREEIKEKYRCLKK